MEVKLLSHEGDLVRLEVEGNVTLDRSEEESDRFLFAAGPTAYTQRVLLNLEKTPLIDSSGIGWLLNSHRKFNEAGGRLILHSLPPMVQTVLATLKLNQVLHIANNEPEAIQIAESSRPSDSDAAPENES